MTGATNGATGLETGSQATCVAEPSFDYGRQVAVHRCVMNIRSCRVEERHLLTSLRRASHVSLAAAVLLGLALNAGLGWWWADPAAGYVLVFYAAREVRDIFFLDMPEATVVSDPGQGGFVAWPN